MPLIPKKIVSIISDHCMNLEERCKGYREEMLNTIADILELERSHRIRAINIQQKINRSNNKVRGSKSFNYYAIPNEPGSFDLQDYVSLVFFDPYEEKYDTLRSELTVLVSGESKKNVSISSNDLGAFYDIIEIEDNRLVNIYQGGMFKMIANIVIVILLAFTVYFIFKK